MLKKRTDGYITRNTDHYVIVRNVTMINRRGKEIEKNFLYAAECRDLETVEVFIRNGGNPNCHHVDRVTALHVAAERGDTELAEILLSSGKLNLNCFTNHGYPPLIIASNSRQLDFVIFLLKNGANVDITERFGKTALHHVVMADSLPFARVLISFGANLEAMDSFNQTPLSEAVVQRSCLRMVELLLKSGADVNLNRGKLVSHIFLEACLQCHTVKQSAVIQCLLQHGVDPNLQHHYTYRNALHLVGISGYLPLAEVLVEWGTKWDHRDRYKKTPLVIAQLHENAKVAVFFKYLRDARRKSEEIQTIISEILPSSI